MKVSLFFSGIDPQLERAGWYLHDYSKAKIESLLGRMFEAERQINVLFESLLVEAFDGHA